MTAREGVAQVAAPDSYPASMTAALVLPGALTTAGLATNAEPMTSAAPVPLLTPAAPLTPLMASSSATVRLPRSYQPQWSVDRSRMPDKVFYYVASTVSARNFAEALLIAGAPSLGTAPVQPQAPPQVTIDSAVTYENAMETYGDQMDTWRRTADENLRYHAYRLETGLATAETRQLLSNLALPLALHQEARYRPASIDASLGERLGNAAASIVVTHGDNGRLAPNYSKLVGTVAAAYIGKSVYATMFNAPELASSHFVTHYVEYSLAGDLATNIGHELVRSAIEPDVEEYQVNGASTEDSYYPLSVGGKLVEWGRSTYGLRNFIQAALTAGLPSTTSQPVEPQPGTITTDAQALAFDQEFVAYGTAIRAWRQQLESSARYHGRRFVGGLAASETQMALQNFIVPIAFSMEPRYIPLGSGHDAGARLGHAFASLLTTRTDAGGHTVNLPVLMGTVGGAEMAKEFYYPRLGTPSLTSDSMLTRTIGLNLGLDALLNIRREFFGHRGY